MSQGVQYALWGGLEGPEGPDTKQDGGRVCREHQTPWSIAKDHRNAGGKRAREQSGQAFSSENWQSFLPLSNWIRAVAPHPGALVALAVLDRDRFCLCRSDERKSAFWASENGSERTERQRQI